ncbi:hypothetical protein D3C87_1628640 [compost metagenome]
MTNSRAIVFYYKDGPSTFNAKERPQGNLQSLVFFEHINIKFDVKIVSHAAFGPFGEKDIHICFFFFDAKSRKLDETRLTDSFDTSLENFFISKSTNLNLGSFGNFNRISC